MSDKVTDAEIVRDVESFVRLVKYCDAYNECQNKTTKFPCAIKVTHCSGQGHCEDWYSYSIVEPDESYNPKEKEIFLKGVLKGWR